jgi:hypothetical protein
MSNFQTCGNCIFGDFERTKKGAIKVRGGSGRCLYHIEPLPLSITRAYGYRPIEITKTAMMPNDSGCPVWKEGDFR